MIPGFGTHALYLVGSGSLSSMLTGYWASDVWKIADCPYAGAKRYGYLDFTPLSATLRLEMKFAMWKKLSTQEWVLTKKSAVLSRVQRLIECLASHQEGCDSLMLRSISEWEGFIREGLLQKGDWKERSRTWITAHGQSCTRVAPDPVFYMLHGVYKTVKVGYEDIAGVSEYDKDVWDIRKLRSLEPAQAAYTLNFRELNQPWLRQAAKSYLGYRLDNMSIGQCAQDLLSIRHFSRYLFARHPTLTPETLNRTVIADYVKDFKSRGRVPSTVSASLTALRKFFEVCAREGWAPFPKKRLILEGDIPQTDKGKPRSIPARVLRQLDAHMDSMPPVYRRMTHIIRHVGMRVSEMLTLEMDCLREDSVGGKYLHFYQSKMSQDHNVPIREEVAEIILEQMRAVRAEYGDGMKWLFLSSRTWGNRRGRPPGGGGFLAALNALAREHNIVDESGNVFHFQTHQFRHTIASDMVNNNVPLKVIQVYLGHHSMDMTIRYARIQDETMKGKHLKTQERIRGTEQDVIGREVNINGRFISEPVAAGDTSWVRKNVLAQALPNGRCALPVIGQQRCPHANACLTCEHFRTSVEFLPVHKRQYAETARIIEVAQANGWQRQVEVNEAVAGSLEQIIESLERVDVEANLDSKSGSLGRITP